MVTIILTEEQLELLKNVVDTCIDTFYSESEDLEKLEGVSEALVAFQEEDKAMSKIADYKEIRDLEEAIQECIYNSNVEDILPKNMHLESILVLEKDN